MMFFRFLVYTTLIGVAVLLPDIRALMMILLFCAASFDSAMSIFKKR